MHLLSPSPGGVEAVPGGSNQQPRVPGYPMPSTDTERVRRPLEIRFPDYTSPSTDTERVRPHSHVLCKSCLERQEKWILYDE